MNMVRVECPVCRHVLLDYIDEMTQCRQCERLLMVRCSVEVLDDDTVITDVDNDDLYDKVEENTIRVSKLGMGVRP